MPRLKYISDGIYRDTTTGRLVHRPIINGTRTERRLTATTVTMARRELAVLKTRQLESRLGIAVDPYANAVSIGWLAGLWSDSDCPDTTGKSRYGGPLVAERAKLKRLLPFWKDRNARESITAEDCRDYHAWRVKRKRSEQFRLNRTVDSELTTLNNVLRWAVQNPRKSGLRLNPMPEDRPRFDDPETVRHCTAVMPMTDEIVHQHAAYLFSNPTSEALGWQLLLECLSGARTSEILACRTDARQPRQPGYQDETALHIHRCKKGIEPWALIEVVPGHSPLAQCLKAFRFWHNQRYPDSAWFIPGRDRKNPVTREALTRALERSSKVLGLPKITSHGSRAYFVRTLRSLGIDDSEIAKRVGHRGGVGEVEKTYGISEPGWFGSRKLDFMPDGFAPAWTPYLELAQNVIELPAYHLPTRTALRIGKHR